MEYEKIISVRLDDDLAERFEKFKQSYEINSSEFIRRAIAERMDRWPEILREAKKTSAA